MWKASLLLFCFPLFCYPQGTPTWDQLRVTFGKFTSYPLTARQAEKAGWKKDASCSGRSNFFYGNRYVKADDDATRVIFDTDGSIAGIQATIDRTDSYPTIHIEPPWISTGDGRVALTAYFRDPRQICVCEGKYKKRAPKKPPIGDRLWIQMADFRKKKDVMVIPLNTDQFAGAPWVEGPCVKAMGRHYLYNTLIDFDCDKALPIFLLFSEQTKSLIGFGWAGPIDVPSTEWEKPPPSLFAVSTQRWIFIFAIKVLFKSLLST